MEKGNPSFPATTIPRRNGWLAPSPPFKDQHLRSNLDFSGPAFAFLLVYV